MTFQELELGQEQWELPIPGEAEKDRLGEKVGRWSLDSLFWG